MKLESIVQKQSYAPYTINIEKKSDNHYFKHLNLKPMWIEILNDLQKKYYLQLFQQNFTRVYQQQ